MHQSRSTPIKALDVRRGLLAGARRGGEPTNASKDPI